MGHLDLRDKMWQEAFKHGSNPNPVFGTKAKNTPFGVLDVEKIIAFDEHEKLFAIFKLKDGRYASIILKPPSERLHLDGLSLDGLAYISETYDEIYHFGLGENERQKLKKQ